MFLGLYTPAEVIEERGKDYFIPAHPRPRAKVPSLIEMILGARHSLIGNWTEDYYTSCVDEYRVIKRQIVFVNTPESIRYVMATAHQNFERKSPQHRRSLEKLIGDGLVISDGETWAKRRPLVSDIVHKKRLSEFAPTMEIVANAMVDRWTELASDHEFDIATEMAELTAEIISRTVFGRNLGAKAARMVVDGFTLYQKSIDPFNLGYFLGADEGWPIFVGPTKRKAMAMVHSVVDSVITAHLEGGGDAGSMIDLMVKRNQRNPDLQLDVTALRNEAATIFLAGSESTATTLTWSWYMLDNAPWVANAMHAEIDAVCGGRTVTMDDLPQLNWCRAVVQEALRLYPPFPIVPRQARDADKIAHVNVEKGALIMIVPWLLHRAGDLWDRPNHFLPERFLNNARFDPYTYMPFSVGPRICAGMNFGLNEAILCLATLAQKFRVRVKSGYTAEPVCRLTLRSAEGMPATIAPRTGGAQ